MRFHAVYWPAFLMSAGLELPKQVFGHGHVLLRGEKMSKSAGNVVDPEALAGAYGIDALRYFLLREVPFGQDGSYSAEAIVTRCNADLANGLGNLAQRCLTIHRQELRGEGAGQRGADRRGRQDARRHRRGGGGGAGGDGRARDPPGDRGGVARRRRRQRLFLRAEALGSAQGRSGARRHHPLRAAEAVRRLAILARWAIPAGADRLLDQLGQAADARDFASLDAWLAPGLALPAPQGVFPRLEPPGEG